MEKIEFSIGDEKRFFDFISKIDDKGKIAIISHNDLDGFISAKVVDEVMQADYLKFIDYSQADDILIKELKDRKIKKVIFTDLNFRKDFIEKIEKIANILVIDHHIVENDFNSDKTVFLNAQGFCASYICYYLFSKIQNIEKLDWLVACACLSDWAFLKNYTWMNEIFKKYGQVFNPDKKEVMKSKFYNFALSLSIAIIYYRKRDLIDFYKLIPQSIGSLGKLEEAYKIINEEIKNTIKLFEKEKKSFKDGYFWEIRSKYQIKELVINNISFEQPDKTFIFGQEKGNFYSLSARRQDGKVDLNEFMKKLISKTLGASAGGHIEAAGAIMLLKDRESIIQRILTS